MSSPHTPSPAEQASAAAARAQADAGIALARVESLLHHRDVLRRRVGSQPLGADPGDVAPPGWAEHREAELVASAAGAQPLSPAQAEDERRALLWTAVVKIIGAVLSAVIAIGIASAMISGMAG